MSGAWSFAFWSISNIAHLLHHTRPEHSKTPLYASKPHKHTYTSPICSQCPPPGISGQFRTTTDTNRHQTTPTDGPRHSKRLFKDAWRLLLTLNGICWSLLESFGVWRRLLVSYGVWRCEEGVWGFWKGIWVLFMDVFKVYVPLREHLSVQALFGAAIALYWKIFERKIFERQNSMHLAFLKHQNTKTSLYKLSKNHWVIALFKKLQFTVSLDHPVFM